MADTPTLEIEPFDAAADDPEAHAAVAAFLAAFPSNVYPMPKPADLPGWPRLAEKDPAWNRRCAVAVAAQAAHWQRQHGRIGDAMAEHGRNLDADYARDPGAPAYARLQAAEAVSTMLLRRALPLDAADLRALASSAVSARPEHGLWTGVPASGVAKQAEDLAKRGPIDDDPARAALLALRHWIAPHKYWDGPKVAAKIDRALGGDDAEATDDLRIAADVPPPAPVGTPGVLVDVKRRLGMLPPDGSAERATDPPAEVVGRDAFPLSADSPLREQHAALTRLIDRWTAAGERRREAIDAFNARNGGPLGPTEYRDRRRDYERIVKEIEAEQQAAVAAVAEVRADDPSRFDVALCEREAAQAGVGYTVATSALTAARDAGKVAWRSGDRGLDFDALVHRAAVVGHSSPIVPPWVADVAELYAADGGLSPGERHVVHRLRCLACDVPPMGTLPPVAERLTRLLDGDGATLLLVPGEAWADLAHADLAGTGDKPRAAWAALLKHAATADASSPSAAWARTGKSLVSAVRPASLRDRVAAWAGAFGRGRSLLLLAGPHQSERAVNEVPVEGNATVMKGLVWLLAPAADAASPRLVADLLLASIKKTPGVGPRCVKVANACVWALGEMAASGDEAVRDAALGQLARLKARVTFRTTLKAIEKALDKAAAKAGVAREDLEELGVPTFGFEGGRRVEELGGATATLRLDGNRVVTEWANDKGKAVKGPPASVKKDCKDDLKELKRAADDAAGVLLAGRDRLDNLFLADKTWRLVDFRERYLNHGLLGPLVRRLVWEVDEAAVLFDGDVATEIYGNEEKFGETAEVRLWHPIYANTKVVMDWRDRLAAERVTQPFKQSHREVYLLTDAERATGTYSNRFAAHVVRQHQFNALCAARGWRNALRLMVDDSYEPPRRDLPAHGLRAEFWVEGIGENYGTDTTDSGSYLRLATDQVRFYRTGAARNYQHAGGGRYDTFGPADEADNHPLPLDAVPPLVLSEVLRDCDLFVGVSSVGNDPTWQDGGPQGRFRDYWQSYSFGDLTQTAQTRKAVLEKLVPRLKIAGRCSVTDKFLVVRGDVRTYKVHLGSGNILMEPNDQYLCIVPDGRAASAKDAPDFLPFEGDRTLSVILSKAMLLAADAKIADRTILSQIRR